jgi:hypothetical protein
MFGIRGWKCSLSSLAWHEIKVILLSVLQVLYLDTERKFGLSPRSCGDAPRHTYSDLRVGYTSRLMLRLACSDRNQSGSTPYLVINDNEAKNIYIYIYRRHLKYISKMVDNIFVLIRTQIRKKRGLALHSNANRHGKTCHTFFMH